MLKPVVIGICAQKGGTCKTTTAIELATQASLNGTKTLVIDFDPQGSLSDVLAIENEESATIYDVLAGNIVAAQAIQTWESDACFDVIPANENLAYISKFLDKDFYALEACILDASATNKYELVIIDSAPMPQTSMAFNVFAAADWVVMPTIAKRQAVKSLTRTVKTIQAFAKANLESPKIAGVLVCDFDARGHTWVKWLEGVKSFCAANSIAIFEQQIRHTVKVEDAQTQHLPVMLYSPTSTAASDYHAFSMRALDLVGLGAK